MAIPLTAGPPGSDDDKKTRTDKQSGVAVKERPKVQQPKMYKVLLHNDHFTTMEFVIWILQTVFRQSEAMATSIMLHIHKTGIGVAGVFPREIAESKTHKVLELAKQNDFPLQCTYEEA
ncbi:MAG: ATP-dependent Clp protease adaptor ClpS [Deltaproteobacteria bacterium]|nr:ATP-dependent Clp protease adaptor ClpS [Deltaproteobacteria bacterium]